MKEKNNKGHLVLLFLAAFIWGFSFVSQNVGGQKIGPYAFNTFRSIIGVLFLIPVVGFRDKKGMGKKPVTKEEKHYLIRCGLICGVFLTIATNLQQLGMYFGTGSGMAGFITAFYILMTPILGIALKKIPGINIWIAVAVALVGLYCICINGAAGVQPSDMLVLLCSVFFAMQILAVDKNVANLDSVRLSMYQFFVVSIIGLIPSLIIDMKVFSGGFMDWLLGWVAMPEAWFSLIFSGVFSSGIAYTLQIVGQEDVNPNIASLVMSFESVFAVIGGWLILHEKLTPKQLFGCIFMFAAILIAQFGGMLFKKKQAKS